jgi:hypothetical protein
MSEPLPDRSPVSPYALNLEELQALPAGTELTFFHGTDRSKLRDARLVRVDDTQIHTVDACTDPESPRHLTDAGITPYKRSGMDLWWNPSNCTVLREHRDQPFHPETPTTSPDQGQRLHPGPIQLEREA